MRWLLGAGRGWVLARVLASWGLAAAAAAPTRCPQLPRLARPSRHGPDAARKEAGELRARLEDARAQVASNEQMIRWLNNQITETQLHYSAGSAGLLAARYSYRPGAPVPPAGTGSTASASVSGVPAPGGVGAAGFAGRGAGAVPAPATAAAAGRPAASTYRTPGTAPSVGASSASAGALPPAAPFSAGSSAAPPGSSGPAARTGFRSNFYASHFGGAGGAGTPAAGAPPAAAAARSLNLAGASAAPPAAQPLGPAAPGGAPASGTASPTASGVPAASSSAAAAKHLTARFEAPTYRMADTAAGRVAVPVTSGT